jgi:hypothetical protein
MAPLEEIGQIRSGLENQLAKFEEDKARQKKMVVACFSDSKSRLGHLEARASLIMYFVVDICY